MTQSNRIEIANRRPPAQAEFAPPFAMPFLGLAPFLRMSVNGIDFLPMGKEMLANATKDAGDANLWMNLGIVMMCLGQRETGLAIQAQALKLKRVFHLAAAEQPAKLRLLMLMAPGDIAANTPIECLLENSDIDLIFYYISAENLFAVPVPEHDVAMVAVCECDENRQLLLKLEHALAAWPTPIINIPQYIAATDRNAASMLLQNVPGLLIPPTLRTTRETLLSVANAGARLADLFENCDFPVILRPVGSHAGRDLEKITCAEDVIAYLARVDGEQFFISRFIDYSGGDGMFRKFRVALIDGVPFACHMAISSKWMIHYLNAGMYDDPRKRAEEARFMTHFDEFALRHRGALAAIHRRTNLDYVCIDCAETRDGELLIFEIDHCMIVHAMDPEHLFPFKQTTMRKAGTAFREFLLRLSAGDKRRLAA